MYMKLSSLKQLASVLALTGILSATSSGMAIADVLMIDVIEQRPSDSLDGLERPDRMMTMDQVEVAYGSPQTRYDAVGDPPITRWDYGLFSVYFEYQWVLESVVRREGELASTP